MEVVKSESPIIGWRVWSLVRPQWLTDISCRAVYPPKERWVATCELVEWQLEQGRTPCAISPGNDCSCGIYATKFDWQVDYWKVMGQVYLWGKVIEHTQGYRAQYAYVKNLIITRAEHQPLAGWLSHLYGVPVEIATKERLDELEKARRANFTNYHRRRYVSKDDLWKIVRSDEESIQERRFARNQLRGRIRTAIRGGKRTLRTYREKIVVLRAKLADMREKMEELEQLKRDLR